MTLRETAKRKYARERVSFGVYEKWGDRELRTGRGVTETKRQAGRQRPWQRRQGERETGGNGRSVAEMVRQKPWQGRSGGARDENKEAKDGTWSKVIGS